MVLIGAVEQVSVEKQDIARIHFDVHEFEALLGMPDAVEIGSGLIAGKDVIDAAHEVGAFEDLKAAVFAGRRIDGDGGTGQEREEHAVLVPVAIILMPGPGAARFWHPS